VANISVFSPSLDDLAQRLLTLVQLDALKVLRPPDVLAGPPRERRDGVPAHLGVLVQPRGPERQPPVAALERGHP
jgi:hypothetical protein